MEPFTLLNFRKGGCRNAHILLFLEKKDKPETPSDINRIVTAEIPDKEKDPDGCQAVVNYMLHGPCGVLKEVSPCMKDKMCSKQYPKEFSRDTNIDKYGYPIYRRRDKGRTAVKDGIELDNTWVVPHNIDLIVQFDAHINVEVCNSIGALVKYLFKYIKKGKDRVTIVIEKDPERSEDSGEEEYRDPSVERLPYHLEGEHQVIFRDTDVLEDVLDNPSAKCTKFLEWFEANKKYQEARDITYADFPSEFVWDNTIKEWRPRIRGNAVGSYEELKIVGGTTHATFRDTCVALGLLSYDSEWHLRLIKASTYSTRNLLRQMFVAMLIFCEVTDPKRLWEENWSLLSEGMEKQERNKRRNLHMDLDEAELKNLTLIDIEEIMGRNSRTLKDFPSIPFPNKEKQYDYKNKLIDEELAYDTEKLRNEHIRLKNGLNTVQREIFDVVSQSIKKGDGGLFFVYGSGGTGKTYLWNTIITGLRAKSKVVLAFASSGIASLLLPGGGLPILGSRYQ
ncbi:uncharacterized protein LOC113293891 [Papaver somniferum]|uniref:uncharacterized protein LOC113293891 n=1 Tax=Papaver somniferum TaxID=3469 RepID=UPI000E6F8187|nr:uncharacterized protein LOC113293891 [Papaver somniferum]